MYSHFVNKGHSLDYLLNLRIVEKLFFMVAMSKDIENYNKIWGG